MEFLPGLSCTKSSTGSLNMHHTRFFYLMNRSQKYIKELPTCHSLTRGMQIKHYIKTSHWLFLGKKKKNPNIKEFKIIPLSKPSSFIEAVRCSNNTLSTWSLPQRLTCGEAWQLLGI